MAGIPISNRVTPRKGTQQAILMACLLVLVFSVGTLLRLYQLGAENLSYDEGIMVHVTSSLDEVRANVLKGRPPVLVVLGYGWVQLFGDSEVAVRSISALAGIASLVVLYLLGSELINQRFALIATAIMSVSIFHVFYSQDYRYYSVLTFFAVLSFYFLAKALRSGRIVYFALYSISGVLIFLTHYQGAFVLTAQGLYFLLRWYKQPARIRVIWLLSLLAIGVGLMPSLYKIGSDYLAGAATGEFTGSVGALGNNGPLSKPPLWVPLHTLLIGFLFITVDHLLHPLAIGASLLLLVAGVALHAGFIGTVRWVDAWRALPARLGLARPHTNTLVMVLCWLIVPVFLPFLISIAWKPIYLPRYNISALPAFCLLLAMLALYVRPVVPDYVALGALVVLLIPGLQSYYTQDMKEQWSEASAYIETQAAPAGESEGFLFMSTNNEPAERIQRTFDIYYPADLASAPTTCTVDAGLIAAQETLDTLTTCSEPYDRVWLITRELTADPGVVDAILADPALTPWSETWQVEHEQKFVGLSVRLLTREGAQTGSIPQTDGWATQ